MAAPRVLTVVEDATPNRSSRWSARRWVTSGIAVALLAAMAIHISGAQGELASLQRLSVRVLSLTCILQLLSQMFLNGSMLLPLRRSLAALGFWELYLVRTGGFFAGSLVPVAGGLAVRLAYLRTRGVTYVDFTWSTLFSNALALGAAALVAVGATGVLWSRIGSLPASILGVTVALVMISVGVVMVFEYLPAWTHLPGLRRWQWLSGMSGLSSSRPLAVRVFALSLMRHVLNFVTFGLLYRSLSGGPDDFVAGGLVYALTTPIRMVNVTPGNVGVAEWFVALVGRMVSYDLVTGLVVALAFRAIGLAAQVLGAIYAVAWLAATRQGRKA